MGIQGKFLVYKGEVEVTSDHDVAIKGYVDPPVVSDNGFVCHNHPVEKTY